MSGLASRVERLKFARLLEVDPDDLTWMDDLDPAAVAGVRDQVTDVLFEQGAGQFGPLLQASKLLPKPLVAKVAQIVFPPLMTAQMSAVLEPDYAAGLVRHFDTEYLADLGSMADPRHIDHLVEHLPDEVLIAVATELVEREDHLTAGRLLGLAPDRLYEVLVDDVASDRDLIEIAFFLEHTDALDPIVACVADERVAALMALATAEARWPDALSLMVHLGEENAARIARIAAAQRPEILEALVAATASEELWAEVLDLLAHVDDDEIDGIAAVPRLVEPDIVVAAASAADRDDRRITLVRLAAAMTEDRQRVLADALDGLDPQRVDELLATADSLGLLADLDWG